MYKIYTQPLHLHDSEPQTTDSLLLNQSTSLNNLPSLRNTEKNINGEFTQMFFFMSGINGFFNPLLK